MVIDIILVVLFLLMLIYGYAKGFIKIAFKLVSFALALVLAYLLARTIGEYISITSLGQNIEARVETSVLDKLIENEQSPAVIFLKEKMQVQDDLLLIEKITQYVFVGLGFVSTFIVLRIVLWIAQKILESIFELPLLKTFNKLGGLIASGALFVVEISVILAVIQSISALDFMTPVMNVINSSVITKMLYEHNIFTSLILSKIL